MILSDLRDYLATHKRAAMDDMVNHFGVDPDALLGMLRQWEAKGRVRRVDAAGSSDGQSDGRSCGSCTICGGGEPRIYEWVERAARS